MSKRSTCMGCGMSVAPKEYHPYAACLMFKGCRDGGEVRANLRSVMSRQRTNTLARQVAHMKRKEPNDE